VAVGLERVLAQCLGQRQGIILIKDARGEVIGLERLYFKPSTAPHELGAALQTAKT
jgi:hypothetical protein